MLSIHFWRFSPRTLCHRIATHFLPYVARNLEPIIIKNDLFDYNRVNVFCDIFFTLFTDPSCIATQALYLLCLATSFPLATTVFTPFDFLTDPPRYLDSM